MSTVLYAGEVSPQAIAFDVSSSNLVPDMSVVSSVTAVVKRPNGRIVEWHNLTISAQNTTGLRATRQLEDGDIDAPGPYLVYLMLSLNPSGVARTPTVAVPVRDRFAA